LGPSNIVTDPRLLSAIYILWRRAWLILSAILIGVSGAYLGFELWPKSYKAHALIMIEAQKVADKFVQSTVSTGSSERLAAISQEILSNTRLQKIIDDYHLFQKEKSRLYPEEILNLMRKNITIRIDKTMSQERTSAFSVEFVGDSPTTVAEITNLLVSFFLEQNLKQRALAAEGTSEFLDSQLAEAKRALEVQEQRLAEYKLAHEGSLPGQESYLMSVIARLQAELQFVEESLSRASLNKANIESAMQSAHATDLLAAQLVEKATVKSDSVPRDKLQSELLQEQLMVSLTRYKPNHPTIVDLRAQIANAKAQEEQSAKSISKRPEEASPAMLRWKFEAKERDENFRNQLNLIEREVALRSAQRNEIIAKMEAQHRQLRQLPVRELQMGAITRDYEISLLTYKNLLDKGQHAHISSEMERRQKGERFRVVDPAKVPERALGPSLWLTMLLGGGTGFALGVVMILLSSMRRNVLIGEWELPPEIPVLARIPIQDVKVATDPTRISNDSLRSKFRTLPFSNSVRS
jgi:succinoglycan biosynthesis transport protein ExoP